MGIAPFVKFQLSPMTRTNKNKAKGWNLVFRRLFYSSRHRSFPAPPKPLNP